MSGENRRRLPKLVSLFQTNKFGLLTTARPEHTVKTQGMGVVSVRKVTDSQKKHRKNFNSKQILATLKGTLMQI